MKEVVLSFKKFSINIDESFFISFLVKPLFVVFIYFGVYSRASGLLGFTGGQITVMISFGLFFLAITHILFMNRDFRLSKFSAYICVFFILSGVLPLLSTFVFQSDPIRILRFSLEIAITFFMFFSVYYFVREKIITPKFFLYSIALLAMVAAIRYFALFLQQITIFRITGLTGLNTLGNSFALSIFVWLLVIYVNSQKKVNLLKRSAGYISVAFLFLALFLTGTRSAFIALLAGVFLFQILGMKSRKFAKYFLIGLVGLGAVLLIFALNFDLSNFWRRFTWENITYMAGVRFSLYSGSVTDLTLLDFLFGRPDFYIFSVEGNEYINPHNHFLAIIRYNGVILFILTVFMFVAIFYKYLGLYSMHKDQKDYRVVESSTIILFIMVVIYTMFSGGRMTRSFNFYITLGFAVGYFELFKNLKSYDEYKELIF